MIKSKDELLFRLTMRFYSGLLEELRELVEHGDPLEQHRRMISYALDYHLRHREYRYVVEYCEGIDFKERADNTWRDELNQLDQAFQDWGGPMIQKGIDAGLFQDRPIQEIMLGLHACFKASLICAAFREPARSTSGLDARASTTADAEPEQAPASRM